jgi:Family of unknown function (DUF6088)
MITVTLAILDIIRRKNRGKIFISKDFIDIGSREAVDQALSRLAREGTIRRVGRGLYYLPRMNEALGIDLAPDTDEVAQALARQTGSRVVPTGAVAANQLGLSTQVPARPVYLTDGRTRTVPVGNTVFVLRHAPPKELPLGSPVSAMVFQALRYLGKEAIKEETVSRLRRKLTARQRKKLLEDAQYTTEWITEVVRRVAAEEPQEVDVDG